MNGKNTRNLFTKTTGFVGGVSAALLLSLPALAQQGPIDPNSNTSPTPAPAAPDTYSPSTGDPTIRTAPGTESPSNTIDRTENPNSVQQPAGRSRVEDRSTGNNPNTTGGNSQDTSSMMGQYQTSGIRPLQEPAGRSRFDDRSTGINQENYDRLMGLDDDSMQYRNRTSNSNPVRTESRQTETNEMQRNQDSSTQNKELQSDSPNQQNPNAGSSDGSGALGNKVDPTNRNTVNQSGNQSGNSAQTPYGSPQASPNQQNPGTRTGVEERTQTVDQQQRTNTTVEQQGGNNTVDTTTQPSSGGQAGGQGAGGEGVPGLW